MKYHLLLSFLVVLAVAQIYNIVIFQLTAVSSADGDCKGFHDDAICREQCNAVLARCEPNPWYRGFMCNCDPVDMSKLEDSRFFIG
ncbi:hypothetical protein TSAR_001039 [Trichomalopsis sarcophagae]|uniref:Uncharacterized protein n=1 Tax=Trichomalopsis sarcophagae TaxID=543379 RepID=A0A232FMC3_9HYME|nr:hypothetical protein TSAR_001039 [Trichomalopsis sarcophagae]